MTSLTNLSSGIIPSSSAGGLPQPPDTPIIQQRPFSFQPVPRPMQTSSFTPVPMEVDAAMRLSPEERKIKMDNKLCLYCQTRSCRGRLPSLHQVNQKLNATVSNESKT